MFRVTRPYLNLLVKPRIFSGFLEQNIILCILKGEILIQMQPDKAQQCLCIQIFVSELSMLHTKYIVVVDQDCDVPKTVAF